MVSGSEPIAPSRVILAVRTGEFIGEVGADGDGVTTAATALKRARYLEVSGVSGGSCCGDATAAPVAISIIVSLSFIL